MMDRIIVQNLKCGGCVNTIHQKLSSLPYVNEVQVNKEDSAVDFILSDQSKLSELKEVLSKLGYPAENEANTITKKAKSFVSCAVGKMS